MGQKINRQTSFLLDIIITGLSFLAGEEHRWWGGMREIAEAEKSPVTISLHLDLYPPPLIPLLAGQCLCSDLLKTRPKSFYGEAREARTGGAMKPIRVGFNSLAGMSS